ncbi:RNA polymerase sigma-70 factor [Reichenbachiella sp. MALMAid0571]|uniref:RNA polymerase sigma-70 factor n=1 Tax=Reichenbachiella sp. MALMAid0571 TaxID=3143939 RepID=UPI0032DFB16D
MEKLIEDIVHNDDQQAFKKLFYELAPKLINYAKYLIKNTEAAEEIACDVLVKFWNNRRKFKPGSGSKNYFFIATKNSAFNFLRDHSKMQLVGLENFPPEEEMIFEDGETKLLDEELKGVIKIAVYELPEKCRMVFQMVKEEYMTYAEVAELMDISTKTVENQMSKALKRIRTAIDDYRSLGNNKMTIVS